MSIKNGFTVAIVSILFCGLFPTYCFGQMVIRWNIEPPGGQHLWFLGSANMDADSGEELVFHNNADPRSLVILDGTTGSVDWYSGNFNTISIAGYNYNGGNAGFSPFCDIDGDGKKEITFWGRINANDPFEIFVVGSQPSGLSNNVLGMSETPILSQNFPNPFNPTTTIKYELTSRGHAEIRIYNVAGKLVRQLLDQELDAGEYTITWDGKDDRSQPVASGIYFYQLCVGNYVSTKKALMLK